MNKVKVELGEMLIGTEADRDNCQAKSSKHNVRLTTSIIIIVVRMISSSPLTLIVSLRMNSHTYTSTIPNTAR